MNSETMTAIVSVLALVLAGLALFRARQAGTEITGEAIASAVQTGTRTAQEITAVVQAGVFAAEQLKNTGRLPDNNAAFEFALSHAQKLLPDLDRATLTTFIESSVLIANQMTAAALAGRASPLR